MDIKLLVKHKAYSAIQEILDEDHIDYSLIKDITDLRFMSLITKIKSKTVMKMRWLTCYHSLQDVYYSDVEMSDIDRSDRRTFYKEARVLSRCIRGHFHFKTDEIMNWYLYFIFIVLLNRYDSRYKKDWVLSSPSNIIHVREGYIWIKNSTILRYNVAKSLLYNYKQVSNVTPRVLIKLDDYAYDFILRTAGTLSTLKYGVMDKSLFETIISEHVRKSTSHSPNVRRWMSNYNIGNVSSPSIILKYIATVIPDAIYQSPFYQNDILTERNMLLSSTIT